MKIRGGLYYSRSTAKYMCAQLEPLPDYSVLFWTFWIDRIKDMANIMPKGRVKKIFFLYQGEGSAPIPSFFVFLGEILKSGYDGLIHPEN